MPKYTPLHTFQVGKPADGGPVYRELQRISNSINNIDGDQISAGTVTSVFGRSGAVIAAANDYTWGQIDKTTSDIADITTRSHTSLTSIGTNTHAQIDSHISSTANPHSVTAAQASAIADAANTVDDTHIDWGTGANQVSAVDVPIADAGGIITGTEVETALQENRTAINLNTTHRSSNGSDHSFIDQDVTSGSTPTFTGTNFTGIPYTGLANGTDGELITWDAAGAIDTVAVGTSGQILTSNGAGAAPTFQNASSGFSDPMTTRGDIIYRDATNTTTRLGTGAANEVLRSDGTDTSWGAVQDATSAVKGIATFDEDSFTVTSGDVKPQMVGFRAYLSADQDNITNSTWTTIQANTESYDTGSDYNTGTYTFTAPVAGYYYLHVNVRWESGAITASKYVLARLYKNGTTSLAQDTTLQPTNNFIINNQISTVVHLDASDTVVAQAWHNNGTNTPDIDSQDYHTFFEGYLIAKD